MTCCPSCGLPYDVARRRRIPEKCGHERCYTCVNGDEPCILCETKGLLRSVSNWPSRSYRRMTPPTTPNLGDSRRRMGLKTNGHFSMMASKGGSLTLDLMHQRQQPASMPATPRLVRSTKNRPRPDCVVETKKPSTDEHHSRIVRTVRLFTKDDDDDLESQENYRSELDIFSNCLDLSNEIGCEDDDMPPPPNLAQQMLSNRLQNLLIIPKNGETIYNGNSGGDSPDLSFFKRNFNRGSSSNANSDVESVQRPSSTAPIRYFRQSQESIMSLMSSSSTSGFGGGHSSRSPSNQPRNLSRRRLNNGIGGGAPSSAESSRSSLTDSGSYIGISARKQIYRRSARNLSIKPELIMNHGTPLPDLNIQPLPFEVPCIDTDTPFVGRDWLFHELHEILVNPTTDHGCMRGAVIYGSVGTGKTAISHLLASRSPFHSDDNGPNYVNIWVNNNESIKGASSLSTDSGFASSSRTSIPSNIKGAAIIPDWRRSTSDAVAVYHFCQIENQIACTLADFLRNFVATLAYNPNFTSYREYLGSRRDLLEYLSIGELCKDPATAFRLVCTEPLNELKKCNKISTSDRNYLILIDSLDEAEYHRPEFGHSIASFLVKYAENLFPSWMKLVLTVKTNFLEHLKGLKLHKINLDNFVMDEKVYGDAADYVRLRINDGNGVIRRNVSCVPSKPQGSGGSGGGVDSNVCPSTRFANHLVTVAKGNFLYVKLTLNLIEKNHLVMKGANYNVLPVNLSEVFLLMFNLKFPTVSAFERAAPILNVILASLYPLTAKQIFEAVNSGLVDRFITWEEFCERLITLQEYLIQRHDDSYVLFHPAFRDWLIRREDGQSPKFLCDLRNGHALLALRLYRACLNKMDSECLQELGHHMLKAHLYKHVRTVPSDISGKDCQLHWLNLRADDIKRSLCTERNIFLPNTKVSRLLLLAGADPDSKTSVYDDSPLLCVAARHGRTEFVALLLEFGADVCCSDSQGLSPLMHAALGGHLDAAQLLHQHGAKLSQVDNSQRCALVHAAQGGHVNVVSFFLQCDWSESYCHSETDHAREELSGHYSSALKQQASQQAFVAAAEAGRTLVCQFLLDLGDVSMNEPDPVTQDTALSLACLNGRKETVEYLLKNRARISYGRCSRPKPPLIQAVFSGCWEIVSTLLAKGACVDEERSENGQTPLIVAAQNGHIGVLELLLSRDANIHAVDDSGRSALCWACINNRIPCTSLLVERGSKLDLFDKNMRAPFHYAAQYGCKQLVQILLDADPKITESPDGNGLRPLEIAIQSKNMDGVQRFLRKGAKLSPVTWAAAKDKPDILLMLFNKLLDDGNVLYRKGRLDDAAQRFQYALKKLSIDCGDEISQNLELIRVKYHLLLNLARCKRKSNDRESAIKLCTEAVQLEPDDSEAYYSRARCLYEAERYEPARLDLIRILKVKPSSKEAADLLSKVGERLKSSQRAKASGLCKFSPADESKDEFGDIRRVSSPKSWEQGSSDSGNIADIDAVRPTPSKSTVQKIVSAKFNSVSGSLKENSFESEL